MALSMLDHGRPSFALAARPHRRRLACSRRRSKQRRFSRRRKQIEPQPSAPPAREENPGLFNEIGKLFEKSKSMLPPLKSPSETFDDLNARARDAGESLSNFRKAVDDGERARGLRGRHLMAHRTARPAPKALPEQGFQGRQEPRHDAAEKCSRSCSCRGTSAAPTTADRKFRDAGFVPVA